MSLGSVHSHGNMSRANCTFCKYAEAFSCQRKSLADEAVATTIKTWTSCSMPTQQIEFRLDNNEYARNVKSSLQYDYSVSVQRDSTTWDIICTYDSKFMQSRVTLHSIFWNELPDVITRYPQRDKNMRVCVYSTARAMLSHP